MFKKIKINEAAFTELIDELCDGTHKKCGRPVVHSVSLKKGTTWLNRRS